ncbi:MAG: hypothetical protein CGU28_17010 [Candidatus Dactylopiibacterium carminicum]|uniref:Water stress and hypersensitive response domain-containing protein n=1 Tax=Candidatus Dactylopiibacterium carminicum TaxID=857335 RepID=A0A272EMN2_9RHOO|nr:LEA type 2 family protein [Candidatus Dactylopiibacterium carminicum]KAF7597719.1 hypothetical protein BGI27_17290 [Candidatus Dactylopiibacterium carminicum]PAS91326.1 MAG: hypothetical protein CGU29_17095 [Candidatus Dactylopiibacterium carminicum]PAS92102.1 MAG: hypothetical protein CGU28_17010 [Candidatus Dactylopiibacterium carminicum]PAS94635.1 MAG: hypothetical protein BSR46_17330 [Candidatus Dactylopiibacterium carminicum]
MRCIGKFLVLLWVGVLAAGCALRWQKPEVRLVEVALAGGNLMEQQLALQLAVHNPNNRKIELDALQFDWLAGETVFASGQSLQAVQVPAQGEARIPLTAKLRLLPLLQRLPQLLDADGRLPYRLRGQADVAGYGTQPFNVSGKLDLPGPR